MFYSTEILSHKNKTELSLLYYISTTNSLKRISRREILELDLHKLLDQILYPKIPFALRLYSQLLRGLVKVWMLKINYYKLQIKNLNLSNKENKQIMKKPKFVNEQINVNLQINDEIISDLEDSCASSLKFERPQINHNLNIDDLNYCHNLDIEFENDLKSIENERKIIKNKTDEITENEEHYFIEAKLCKYEIKLPNLLNSFITGQFNSHCSIISKKEDPTINCNNFNNYDLGDYDFKSLQEISSVEDPRISSSLSHEKDLSRINKKIKIFTDDNENTSKAYWFYSLLLMASNGEIQVSQKEAYGEIIVLKL